MNKKIKGVNLGGWLVLEKWMSPHLFDETNADDEYYLAHDLSADVYQAELNSTELTLLQKKIFCGLLSWVLT